MNGKLHTDRFEAKQTLPIKGTSPRCISYQSVNTIKWEIECKG